MEIYWERQQGNNCRIHSLNAMFSHKFLDESKFKLECSEYDKIVEGLNSIDMDGFAECRSIISYIVDKYTQRFTLLIPININGIHNKNRELWQYNRLIQLLGDSILEYFEFNKGHIWFNKYIDGSWHKIDSLSGVTKQNTIRSFGNNGFLLVFESSAIYKELEFILDILKTQFSKKIEINNTKNDNKNQKVDNDDDELEIGYYNLYHLLKLIKLDYIESDSNFNNQISILRMLLKTLKIYIDIQRKQTINVVLLKKLKIEIVNIIRLL